MYISDLIRNIIKIGHVVLVKFFLFTLICTVFLVIIKLFLLKVTFLSTKLASFI